MHVDPARGCASQPTPSLPRLLPRPKYCTPELTGVWKERRKKGEERKKDKEEALLIGDALILGKAARLYRGWANIGVPCDGQGGSKIREEKEWRGKE